MGLFDEIKCDYPLPDGFCADGIRFQTKDLECRLLLYEITSDGRLVVNLYDYEATPKEELPYPDKPYIGCIRRVEGSHRVVDTEYHGDLEFYASNLIGAGPDGFWTEDDAEPWNREYKARFTNGRVEWIRLVSNEGWWTKGGGSKHIKRKDPPHGDD